jgi:hypothetical protein
MGEALRSPFDLPIAVAGGFFNCIKHFIGKNPTKHMLPKRAFLWKAFSRTLPLLQIQMARFAHCPP